MRTAVWTVHYKIMISDDDEDDIDNLGAIIINSHKIYS